MLNLLNAPVEEKETDEMMSFSQLADTDPRKMTAIDQWRKRNFAPLSNVSLKEQNDVLWSLLLAGETNVTTIIHSSPKETNKPEFLRMHDLLNDSVVSPSISDIEDPTNYVKTHQRMIQSNHEPSGRSLLVHPGICKAAIIS